MSKLGQFVQLSVSELKALMAGRKFRDIYDELNNPYLEPAREEAKKANKPRPRMMDLLTVETALAAGEVDGA